jgi:hypothetical protein
VTTVDGIRYSRYDLISKELSFLEEQGFISRFFSVILKEKKLRFKISVPNDLFSRAEILCDDIIQMRSEDKEYTQGELAEHVFLDFLDEVRNHDGNVGAIYMKLDVRKQQLPLINDSPLFSVKSKTSIEAKIDRCDVLRAEWLLKDLSYFTPKHGIDVEELIEIVYLDFLLEYSKGRRKNVLKDILDEIEDDYI